MLSFMWYSGRGKANKWMKKNQNNGCLRGGAWWGKTKEAFQNDSNVLDLNAGQGYAHQTVLFCHRKFKIVRHEQMLISDEDMHSEVVLQDSTLYFELHCKTSKINELVDGEMNTWKNMWQSKYIKI